MLLECLVMEGEQALALAIRSGKKVGFNTQVGLAPSTSVLALRPYQTRLPTEQGRASQEDGQLQILEALWLWPFSLMLILVVKR